MRLSRFALLLASTGVLAACSSAVPEESFPSVPSGSLSVRADEVFTPIEKSRVFFSLSMPSLLAAPCDGTPVLDVKDSSLLAAELPVGVRLSGNALSVDALPGAKEAATRLVELPLAGGATLSLRCLPEGFPDIRVEGRFSAPLALTVMPTVPGGRPWRMLLEPNGFPFWFESVPGAVADFFATDRGLVTFTIGARPINSFTNLPGLGFHEVGFDGTELRSWVPTTGLGLDNHGAAITASGNLLALRYDLVEGGLPKMPVLPAQAQDGRALCPEVAPSSTDLVLRGRVVELDTSGKVLHEWRIEDHLPFAATSAEWVNVSEDPERLRCAVDAEHLNAVAFYPSDDGDQVLVTGRHMDGAAMISWPSGEVLWTLGGSEGERSLRILGDPLGGPVRPHDANLLDAEHVLLYDNRIGEPSRVLVYRLDLASRSAELVASSTIPCGEELCAAFAMGSSRPVVTAPGATATGVIVGLGTAPVTAVELGFSGEGFSTSPAATLVVADSWAYRVLPIGTLDVAAVVAAQTASS